MSSLVGAAVVTEPGVACTGGCGRVVMPVSADDVGEQRAPWYCEDCFRRVQGNELRFFVQWPHVTNEYAVIDRDHGALVFTASREESSQHVADALNLRADLDSASFRLLTDREAYAVARHWAVLAS